MATVYVWFVMIMMALCTIVIAYLSLIVTTNEWNDVMDAEWEEEHRGK